MLTPEQLLYLPDNLVRLYAQLEEDILADMAARISARELFIPAADWQFQKLAEMGNTYDMILAKLSAATEKTEQELREMMTIAASESLKYDDAVHKAAGKELPPLNQSVALLATLNAGMEKTKGYFQNLCRTTANHGSKQFVDALDRAYMQVISGAFTKEQAIKTAVKDLASQGIAAAEYKNGRKMSLESAVRMNVVTGVNQTCAELQLQRCDEAGCDLVEVSAHAGARPSHAVWQGKLYSRSGTHPKYPDFALSTGYGTVTGLCGANCRHNFYPFYEGISKRAYTHRELGQMNARTIRYNGQRLTEYEASQVQRKLERNLRRWKREQAAMKAAGQSTAEAVTKLNYWRGERDSFIRQTGFKRQYSREEIFSGGRIVAHTRKDAEQYAKEHLGMIEVSFKNIPLSVANCLNAEIMAARKKFGALQLAGVEKLDGTITGFYAAYHRTEKKILLGDYDIDDMAETAKMVHETGYWSTSSAVHALRHEIGHSIYYVNITDAKKAALENLRMDVLEQVNGGIDLSPEKYAEAGKTQDDLNADCKKAGQYVSAYALYDANELVAESVAEYMDGKPKAVAKHVLSILMEW